MRKSNRLRSFRMKETISFASVLLIRIKKMKFCLLRQITSS